MLYDHKLRSSSQVINNEEYEKLIGNFVLAFLSYVLKWDANGITHYYLNRRDEFLLHFKSRCKKHGHGRIFLFFLAPVS